jgi:hypothetical protein
VGAGHNLRLILRHLARLLRALLRLLATDPRAAKIAFHPPRIDLFRAD